MGLCARPVSTESTSAMMKSATSTMMRLRTIALVKCSKHIGQSVGERGVRGLDLLTVADITCGVEQPGTTDHARERRLARVSLRCGQMRQTRLQRDREILGAKRRHPDRTEVAARNQIAHFSV